MKKIIGIAVLLIFVAGTVFAFQPPVWLQHGGIASGVSKVAGTTGYLFGVWISGQSGVTMRIQDTQTTSFLIPDTYLPLSSTVPYWVLSFEPPLPYNSGVTITPTSSGSYQYMIYYRDR